MSFNWGIVEMGLPSKWIFLKKKCSFSVQSKLRWVNRTFPYTCIEEGGLWTTSPGRRRKPLSGLCTTLSNFREKTINLLNEQN